MQKRRKFDIKNAPVPNHTMVISKMLDPYTAKLARFFYNLGFTGNMVTALDFILGMSGVAVMLIMRSYTGLIIAAILIMLRNIGDTIDGKIARGSGNLTPIGGFSDIITDWLFFHAAFFVAVGYLTNNLFVGFLCVTGYMSREFARTKFTHFYGTKITETKEAKKLPLIASIVRRYDIGTFFWLVPILMLIFPLAWIIYFIAAMEYTLMLGELGFDAVCLINQGKKKNQANLYH